MSRARAAEQGGRTVMLTMRNAVDQTRKVAIEAPQGSTVRKPPSRRASPRASRSTCSPQRACP